MAGTSCRAEGSWWHCTPSSMCPATVSRQGSAGTMPRHPDFLSCPWGAGRWDGVPGQTGTVGLNPYLNP